MTFRPVYLLCIVASTVSVPWQIYLKIGTEVLQVARGDGKDKDPDHVSCITGPDSGTLSSTTMTLSVSLNLDSQRGTALCIVPQSNREAASKMVILKD